MPLAYQPWYANNEYLILDWQKIHPAGKITKSITSRVTDLLLWIVERHLFNTSCWFKVYLYCNYLFCLFLSFFMYRIAFNLNWCNCYPRKPFGFLSFCFSVSSVGKVAKKWCLYPWLMNPPKRQKCIYQYFVFFLSLVFPTILTSLFYMLITEFVSQINGQRWGHVFVN